MDIKLLKELIALSRGGNLEEAADQLYTTQSTLSKHIKKMEDELGAELFDRSTRPLQLTEAGHMMLGYAVKIESMENEWLSKLSSMKQRHSKKIKIGMENVLDYKIKNQKLMDVLMQFRSLHPDIELEFSSGKMYEVYESLLSGQLDFAIFRYHTKTDMSAFEYIPIANDRIVAICSKQHHLAGEKSVTLNTLQDEKFLLSTEKSFIRNYILDTCRDLGFTPHFVVIDNHMRDAVELAAPNMGIYFCMKKSAKNIMNSNVVALALEPAYMFNVALAYNKHILSEASKELWQFMNQRICEYDAGL